LVPHFKAAGIKYLDYSTLLDPTDPRFHLAGDLHPTTEAYEIVATSLVKDLDLR
jgi:hypothetical protein